MKLAAAVLSASLLVLASADSRGRRPSHRRADERTKPNNGTSVLMSTNKHCLEDYLRPPIEAFGSFRIVSVAFCLAVEHYAYEGQFLAISKAC